MSLIVVECPLSVPECLLVSFQSRLGPRSVAPGSWSLVPDLVPGPRSGSLVLASLQGTLSRTHWVCFSSCFFAREAKALLRTLSQTHCVFSMVCFSREAKSPAMNAEPNILAFFKACFFSERKTTRNAEHLLSFLSGHAFRTI